MSLWTQSERGLLTLMWPTHTTAEIADALDGRSKNAVIGEAHRIGLPRKKPAPPREPKPKKPKPPPAAKPFLFNHSKPKAAPKVDNANGKLLLDQRGFAIDLAKLSPPKTAVELAELAQQHCRWPYGHGSSILFCGAAHVSGLPYCALHCRRAYRPVPSRR